MQGDDSTNEELTSNRPHEAMEFLIPLAAAQLLILLGFLVLFARFYRRVPSGKVAVRTGHGGMRVVTGKGVFVIPMMHELNLVHAETEQFEESLTGVPCHIVVQLKSDEMEAIKLAAVACGNKGREGTREVLQTLIDTSVDLDDLDARLAQVGYRRL